MKFQFLGKLRDEDGNSGGESRPPPVDEVQRLTQQGYSETEITEQLRDRGYSYSEITEALNEAVKESASTANQGGQDYGPQPQAEPAPQPSQAPPAEPAQPQPVQQPVQQEPLPPVSSGSSSGGDYDTHTGDMGISPEEEELIEIIVSEHMSQVDNHLDQIWDEIETLKQDMKELKVQVDEISIRKEESENMFVESMDTVQEHFEQTQARMGGMEKALQQVLPSLVENVRELSTIVEDMREDNYQ